MTVIALLGSSSLLGKEIKLTLESRRDLWSELRLLSTAEEEAGMLTDVDGAADFVRPANAESLSGVNILVMGGDAHGDLPTDLTAGTTTLIVSPTAAPPGGLPVVAGVNLEAADPGRPLVSPHPVVVTLAHLLRPLFSLGLTRATACALQPASIRGQEALDELLEQTRSILSFGTDSPREIFGGQLAFNLLPVPGAGAEALADLRRVIGDGPDLALEIVQASVFHGCGISLVVELAPETRPEEVRQALAADPFVRAAEDPEHLGPIDSAASEEVIVGEIGPSPGQAGRFSLWAVVDNLTRGGALNALAIIEALAAPRR